MAGSLSPCWTLQTVKLIPRRPRSTDHQPQPAAAQQRTQRESWISGSLDLLLHPLCWDSPPLPESMQYSRQFELRLIHHSNSYSLRGYVLHVCVGLCADACVVALCEWQQSACDVVCAVCVQMSLQCLISSGMHSVMR